VSAAPVNEGLLVLDDVAAGYTPGLALLRGVSLDVQKGEVAAVVSLDATGGKSTLVRVAAGLMPPWRGRVRFGGEDVYAMGFSDDQRYRRRCATVLEGGAMLVNLSIRDNVALPLRYHQRLRGRELAVKVDKLLDQAGFSEDPRAFPWQVSVRGRRLAAFARALALDPELVLVDRFFEGLEMPDWKRLFELVLELNHAEGTTWLLVSELDPAIFQVAERVAVLEGGRVLDYGHRRQLYQDERVQAAFEAATDPAVRGARKTGRVDVDDLELGSRDSDRILLVDTDEELKAFGASSDDATTGAPLDTDATINIGGRGQHLDTDATINIDGRGQHLDTDATINIGGRGQRAGLAATHAGDEPSEDTIEFDAPPSPAAPRPRPEPGPARPKKPPTVRHDLDAERTITIDGFIDLHGPKSEEEP
jgi:ABC-type transporter Mla maintaining outer membrane lipid asymmetry ATPase subunit MlaF